MSKDTIKLKTAEAARIATLISRVVPQSYAEGKEIEAYVVRLIGGRS